MHTYTHTCARARVSVRSTKYEFGRVLEKEKRKITRERNRRFGEKMRLHSTKDYTIPAST